MDPGRELLFPQHREEGERLRLWLLPCRSTSCVAGASFLPLPKEMEAKEEGHKVKVELIECTLKECSKPRVVGAIETKELSVRDVLIRWDGPPRSVLIIKRWKDAGARRRAAELAAWLRAAFGVQVHVGVEEDEWDEVRKLLDGENARLERLGSGRRAKGSVRPFIKTPRDARPALDPDLLICIGGDGTVLYASALFQGSVPPVITMHGGSLGFMTVFDARAFSFLCRLFKGVKEEWTSSKREGTAAKAVGDEKDKEIDLLPTHVQDRIREVDEEVARSTRAAEGASASAETGKDSSRADELQADAGEGEGRGGDFERPDGAAAVTTSPFGPERHAAVVPVTLRTRLKVLVYSEKGCEAATYEQVVLNEVTLERGRSASLCAIEAYLDDIPLTTIQADGVILATPTGSTAYSLAAGGSMVLPSVPAILVTPICPHSLSFRPLALPDSITVKLKVPETSTEAVSVSFDGKQPPGRVVEIKPGGHALVSVSACPLPLISMEGSVGDWVHSIKEKLGFNLRAKPAKEP